LLKTQFEEPSRWPQAELQGNSLAANAKAIR
jgi:hypothetical protein